MELTSFVIAMTLLILLAVTSVRFGVDSTIGLSADGRDSSRRGIL